MPLDFPSSPSNGQTYPGPGGITWVYDGTKWVIQGASGTYLPLTGGVLASPGNLTVRGGILGGAAGTVPAAGSMLLNANTVAPPAGLSSSVYVVGADTGQASLGLDAFGTGAPLVVGRRARGTAASQTAVQSGDTLLFLAGSGYGASAYNNSFNTSITFGANENWTGSAQGSQIVFRTNPNGTTAPVGSLVLAGNTATFSGTVQLALAGIGFGGPPTTGQARVVCDTNVMVFGTPPGNGSFYWTTPGNSNVMQCDNVGNLSIITKGYQPGGGSWAASSAREVKQDIKPYTKGLDAVLGLKPVSYRYNDKSGYDTKPTYIGLVHDETAHMPEMHCKVTLDSTADKPGREVDALDCSAVTWALVNAIKELQAEIDTLKKARK